MDQQEDHSNKTRRKTRIGKSKEEGRHRANENQNKTIPIFLSSDGGARRTQETKREGRHRG